MLSAVVLCADGRVHVSASADAMVRTLASLVHAAVEGVVRDVTLATVAGSDQAARIADHAGCGLAEASDPAGVLSAGVAATRGDLVLVLRAGRAPLTGFVEEIIDCYEVGTGGRPALLRAEPETFVARLLPSLSPVAGVVFRKRDVAPVPASLAELARTLASPVTLRTRLRNVV